MPWTPGSRTCGSCGESLEAAAVQGPDPHAVPLLKRVLPATFVIILIAWSLMGWALYAAANAEADVVAVIPWLWTVAVGATCAVAVLSGPLWLPGGRRLELRSWLGIPPRGALLMALPLAAAAAAAGYAMRETDLGLMLFSFSPAAGLLHSIPAAAGSLVALLSLELFMRGLVFDALARMSGKGHAAIGVSFISVVLLLHPFLIGLSIAASMLRMRCDSLWPGYLVAVAGLLGTCWGLF